MQVLFPREGQEISTDDRLGVSTVIDPHQGHNTYVLIPCCITYSAYSNEVKYSKNSSEYCRI
jgi:hypothetical protein